MTGNAENMKPAVARRDIGYILGIPLNLSVEIGRARLLVGELTQLGQGSVLEFENTAGTLLEIFVEGKLIGRGEPVVVNEGYGVRIIEIVSPLERVRQLG